MKDHNNKDHKVLYIRDKLLLKYNIEDVEDDEIFERLEDDENIKILFENEVDYLKDQGIMILKKNEMEVIIEKPEFEIKYLSIPFNACKCDINGKISHVDKIDAEEKQTAKTKKVKFLYNELRLLDYHCSMEDDGVKLSCKLCNKDNLKMKIFSNKKNYIWSTFSKTDCNDDAHFKHYQTLANKLHKKWLKENKETDKLLNLNKFSKDGIKQIILKNFPKMIKHIDTNELWYYSNKDKHYVVLDDDKFETMIYQHFFDDADEITTRKMKDAKNAILRHELYSHKMPFETDLINFKNGIYNPKTKELIDHSSAYFFNNIININYNADVDTSDLEKIIDQWELNISLRQLKIILGYVFQYENDEQLLFFAHGRPGTGKSTFGKMLHYVLNNRCIQIQSKPLLANNRHGLGLVMGKTCCIDMDFEEDTFFKCDIKALNILTDGDDLLINPKNKTPFTYTSTAKYFIISNYEPSFPSGKDNDGFFRRLFPITFNHVFRTGQDKSTSLFKKFKKNSNLQESFVKLIIEGMEIYNNRNDFEDLFGHEQLKELNKKWEYTSETVLSYLHETFDFTNNKNDVMFMIDLRDNYVKWCLENGNKPTSNKKILDKLYRVYPELENLQNKGLTVRNNNKIVKGLRGLKLKDNNIAEGDSVNVEI